MGKYKDRTFKEKFTLSFLRLLSEKPRKINKFWIKGSSNSRNWTIEFDII